MSFSKKAHVTSHIALSGNTLIDISEVSFRAVDLDKSSEKGTAFDAANCSVVLMKWFVRWSILKTNWTSLNRIYFHMDLLSNKSSLIVIKYANCIEVIKTVEKELFLEVG